METFKTGPYTEMKLLLLLLYAIYGIYHGSLPPQRVVSRWLVQTVGPADTKAIANRD